MTTVSRFRTRALLTTVFLMVVLTGLMAWRAFLPDATVKVTAKERSLDAQRRYVRGLEALDIALAGLDTATDHLADGDTAVRTAFHEARRAYKRVEALTEYYAPVTAAAMNGAALEQPDDESPSQIVKPTGFQVIETSLFPAIRREDTASVRQEVAALRVNAHYLITLARRTWFDDTHLFDATRLEIGRIVTLGLANFDAPLSGAAPGEAAAALAGVRSVLVSLQPIVQRRGHTAMAVWNVYDATLRQTIAALDTVTDGDRFDRLGFIIRHANPLAMAIGRVQQTLGVAHLPDRRAWRTTANTVFEEGAWDPSAYAPSYAPTATKPLIALGRALFADPRLSSSGDTELYIVPRPDSRLYRWSRALAALSGAHRGHTPRNTPTILGVGLQPAAFADARVAYLEDQVTDVVGNDAEMGGGVDAAAKRLARDPAMRRQFANAFVTPRSASKASDTPEVDTATVTSQRLRIALAAYMRSLTPMHSRFDQAVHGDTTALSATERLGFTLFMGKARCGTCHFAPLFNGVTPPGFAEMEVEVIGVPTRPAVRNAVVDADVGRERIDHAPLHRHAFKTPTLRNIALTAPYMHNGAYSTLEEVVDFYNRGGGAGVGAKIPNQTLPSELLHLTTREQRALVAFMKALTDTVL